MQLEIKGNLEIKNLNTRQVNIIKYLRTRTIVRNRINQKAYIGIKKRKLKKPNLKIKLKSFLFVTFLQTLYVDSRKNYI